MSKYVITIDQGTTTSRVLVFDERGNIINKVVCDVLQYYPKPGFVELDAQAIYSDVVDLVVEALKSINVSYSDIIGLGITNQRETTVLWNKETGQPIYHAICWQSAQSSSICDELEKNGYGEFINNKTGLIINPYFSATKIKWILDNVEGAKKLMSEDKLLFGTMDSYITWRLTKGKAHVSDYTNASRTMLFNIKTLKWDTELLELFGIKASILPKVISSNESVGLILEDKIKDLIDLNICAIAGDQEASLIGHTAFELGDTKITYGTGAFLLTNTADKLYFKDGMLTTIAYAIDGKVTYAIEGSVFMAGGAVSFIRDNLKLIDEVYDTSFTAKQSNGVCFVPALTGLAAPYWDSNLRGAIFGLSRGTTKEEIALATLEAIACSIKDIIDGIGEDGIKYKSISVDGGLSLNKRLMQIQSNMLDCQIKTINTSEATALGIFYLVGLNTGLFKDLKETKRLYKNIRLYSPEDSEYSKKLYNRWQKAIKAIKLFSN